MKQKKKNIWPAAGLCLLCLTGLFWAAGFFWREEGRKEGGKEKIQEGRLQKEVIYVEGLQREYNFLFLTDTHAVIKGENKSEQEMNYEKERYDMFKGQDERDSAGEQEAWFAYANEQKMDGVLLGGDILDTPSAENVRWLKEQLESLSMPYVYTPGNHDWTYPWEYMTEKGKQEYLPLLSPYMEGNTAVHAKEFGEITVVAVDNSSSQVNEGALAEYEAILKTGRPVIVLTHIPYLTRSILPKAKEAWEEGVVIGGGNYGGIYPNQASEKFAALTTASKSSVEAVLAGHVHFYDKGVIEGEKDVTQIAGAPGFEGNAVWLQIRGAQAK